MRSNQPIVRKETTNSLAKISKKTTHFDSEARRVIWLGDERPWRQQWGWIFLFSILTISLLDIKALLLSLMP